MTETTIATTPVATPEARPGPAAKTPEWYAARRIGVTATEARDLAKGYKSAREKIKREKLTGERADLSGNQYVEYGNLREPIIAAWIAARFGIPASDALYVNIADPRRLATPDGVEVDPFGTVLVSETKTSKHDLTPGRIDENGVLVLTKGPGGKWYLQDNHFADTGYYDQMQWQMFVLGAERTLFAYEQHDSDWSGWPTRAPKTLNPEPGWCWVVRDEKRIAELIAIVDAFMVEVEEARAALEAGADVLPEVPADYERRARIRELGREVLAARKAEAAAKKEKEGAWKELQELLAEEKDFVDEDFGNEGENVRVSVTTSFTPKKKLNRERMVARAPKLVESYEKLVERYTETITEPSTTMTVTEPKGK